MLDANGLRKRVCDNWARGVQVGLAGHLPIGEPDEFLRSLERNHDGLQEELGLGVWYTEQLGDGSGDLNEIESAAAVLLRYLRIRLTQYANLWYPVQAKIFEKCRVLICLPDAPRRVFTDRPGPEPAIVGGTERWSSWEGFVRVGHDIRQVQCRIPPRGIFGEFGGRSRLMDVPTQLLEGQPQEAELLHYRCVDPGRRRSFSGGGAQ